MSDLGAYRVVNKVNKEDLNVFIEWENSSFKVIVSESTKLPWMGEMTVDKVDFFSTELSKSPEDYLSQTKDIFSGKNPQVEFVFENNLFVWKGGLWILGKIEMKPISDVEVISIILHKVLYHQYVVTKDLHKIKNENEQLLQLKAKLTNSLNQMVEMKSNMEAELYKKFVLLLNTKKERIRELEKSLEKKDTSVFDAGTDESDLSCDESIKKESTPKKSVPTKRKAVDKKLRKGSKHSKQHIDSREINLSPINNYAVASTSKNSMTEISNTSKRHSQSSNETDCDLQLNYAEDDPSEELASNLNEKLEPEMSFSD